MAPPPLPPSRRKSHIRECPTPTPNSPPISFSLLIETPPRPSPYANIPEVEFVFKEALEPSKYQNITRSAMKNSTWYRSAESQRSKLLGKQIGPPPLGPLQTPVISFNFTSAAVWASGSIGANGARLVNMATQCKVTTPGRSVVEEISNALRSQLT